MRLGPAAGGGGDERGQLAERRAARRPPADRRHPTRIAPTSASRSSVVIASGSVDSALPETVRQPLRDAVATSGASARSDAATTASGAARGSRPRGAAGRPAAAAPDVERRGQPGSARDDAVAEDADRRPRRRRRPASPASRQAPAAADPPDQRGGDRGGARIEGEEGSRLARHPAMLPGRAGTGRSRGRPARSGVPGRSLRRVSSSRAISSSIPVSSARISLAEARSPPKTPRRTGSKNSIAFAPSARYGRLASRKWTAGPVRPTQLDLAGDLLDELVALLLGRLERRAHAAPPIGLGASGGASALKAW